MTDRFRLDLDGYSVDLKVTAKTPRPARRPLRLILGEVQDRHDHSHVTTYDVSGRDLMSQLLDNQRVLLTVDEEDVFGEPIPADRRGTLSAASSDDTLATVTPGDNPGEFWVAAVDGVDNATAVITIGDDVTGDTTPEFFGSASFELFDHRHGVPAQLSVTVGTPEDKPVV